jgi:hypothetical protein
MGAAESTGSTTLPAAHFAPPVIHVREEAGEEAKQEGAGAEGDKRPQPPSSLEEEAAAATAAAATTIPDDEEAAVTAAAAAAAATSPPSSSAAAEAAPFFTRRCVSSLAALLLGYAVALVLAAVFAEDVRVQLGATTLNLVCVMYY